MLKKASARSERSEIPLVATAAPAAVAAELAKNFRRESLEPLFEVTDDDSFCFM
jgi:hypothetical protein